MKHKLLAAITIAIFVGIAGSSGAAVITLPASFQGWINQDNASSSGSYLVGNCVPNDCISIAGEFRNFFGFDIPRLSDIVSATLLLNTLYPTMRQNPTMTYYSNLGWPLWFQFRWSWNRHVVREPRLFVRRSRTQGGHTPRCGSAH